MRRKLRKSVVIVLIIIVCLGVYFMRDKDELLLPKDEVNNENNVNEPEKPKTAKLTLVGDFLFEQPYYDSLDKGDDKDHYFKSVKHYFEEDDLSIGNMEVVIGNENMEVSGVGYNFCAPESIGNLVNTLDLQVLSTANNHTFDRRLDGIKSSIDFFKNNTNILTVGTDMRDEEFNKERTLTVNGIKFGFLSYTYGTNIKVPEEYRNYVGLYRNPDTKTVTEETKALVSKEVSHLKNQVDVLIVMMHWGNEFTYKPNEEQKEMANLLNSLGVDIIIGSHSHSIEPIEWIGDEHKTLVYYSMGNFVSADYNITRTNEEYNNAYQVGLLSTLNVTKNEDKIEISDVSTEAIVNYYDQNLRNFELIPLKEYTEEQEKGHYRYKSNFNRNFVERIYTSVIPEEFR